MSETNAGSRQYVTFNLDRELFGVELTRTREILSLTPVTRVPQTPAYLLGVINLRGQVVPVVDMRLKLGLATAAETEESCIIVVEVMVDGEALVVGALCDAVREVLEVRGEQIEPPPRLGTRLKTEFLAGMGKVDDCFIMLLNMIAFSTATNWPLFRRLRPMDPPAGSPIHDGAGIPAGGAGVTSI